MSLNTRPTAADAVQSCRSIVGAGCRDPIVLDKLAEKLPSGAFTDLALLAFWEMLVDMRQAGRSTTDAKAVAYEAKRRRFGDADVLSSIGGVAGYARLTTVDACLNDSIGVHLRILKEFAQWRVLERIGCELASRVQAGTESAADVQQWLQEQVSLPAESDDDGPVLLSKTIRELANPSQQEPVKETIRSGFSSLDQRTGGWLPGNYICLAARPSVGKSALGFQICCNAARYGAKVLYVSVEMTDQELSAREIAANTGISVNDVLAQKLENSQREKIRELADEYDIPLFTWSPSSATIQKVEAHVRCLQASTGCDFVAIDYLSLLDGAKKHEQEWEKITRISRHVKQMAKRLKIPVMVLSQVNRESEKGTNKDGKIKRPTLADLRYSGAVEQDADMVMFLHRETRSSTEAELILAKGRNVELGIIALDYDGAAFTFSEPMGEEWIP